MRRALMRRLFLLIFFSPPIVFSDDYSATIKRDEVQEISLWGVGCTVSVPAARPSL